MGRPIKIMEEIKDGIIGAVEFEPETTLQEIGFDFEISPMSVRKILNDDKIKYYKKIAIPPLTEAHKLHRVEFANMFANLAYHQMPIIIFTDEASIQVNLDGQGIWRRRGEYPPGSFFEKNAFPIKCMVWGAIGPRGFRTTLIRINGVINAETYINMLHENDIYGQIYNHFGDNFYFQQDNARPHTAQVTQTYLDNTFPNRLKWPAKSPDLSPIEQIWSFLKNRISGIKFRNADELFNRIKTEWDLIPDKVIHNAYSSFLARCKVCVELKGECLNTHWDKVRKVHNLYRRDIQYRFDHNLNMFTVEV
jgi:hypothetical protein